MDVGTPVETVIRIVVPGVPKALARNKHRIAKSKGGKSFVQTYLPAQSRDEKAMIRDFACQVMGGKPPLDGPMDLRIGIFLPIAASWPKKKQALAHAGLVHPDKKPDFDNFTKMVCDGLNEVVFRDDCQVTNAAIWKRYSSNPRLVIEIRPIVLGAA